jgi:hypothetical protein
MAQDAGEVIRDSSSEGHSDASAPSSSLSTEQIRAQIEETRAGMSQTIDAIQERLDPTRLVKEAVGTVKDATVGRAKHLTQKARTTVGELAERPAETLRTIAQLVREHPVPTGVVGIAATGLLARAQTRPRTGVTHHAQSDRRYDGAPGGHTKIRRAGPVIIAAVAGAACWTLWKAAKGATADRDGTNISLPRQNQIGETSDPGDYRI